MVVGNEPAAPDPASGRDSAAGPGPAPAAPGGQLERGSTAYLWNRRVQVSYDIAIACALVTVGLVATLVMWPAGLETARVIGQPTRRRYWRWRLPGPGSHLPRSGHEATPGADLAAARRRPRDGQIPRSGPNLRPDAGRYARHRVARMYKRG